MSNFPKQKFYKKCEPVLLTVIDIDDESKKHTFFGESDREAFENAVYSIDDLYAFNEAYNKYEKNEIAFNCNYGIHSNYDIKKDFIEELSLEEIKRYIRMSGYKVSLKKSGITVRLDKTIKPEMIENN